MEKPKNAKYQDIKLLSFDIDNTLIDLYTLNGTFPKTWQRYKPKNGVLLTYNTGRLIDDVLTLIERQILPPPDYIIAGVGTQIYDYRNCCGLKEFNRILDEGWDVEAVEAIIRKMKHPIHKQPSKFQNSYKRSYFFYNATPKDIAAIEEIFQQAGLNVNIVYSGEKYLDILPRWANKGNALRWLLTAIDLPPQHVLVAGDSGNDAAMFLIKDINGILVANAHEELLKQTKDEKVYHAKREKGDGVIEGLIFYGVLSEKARNHFQE